MSDRELVAPAARSNGLTVEQRGFELSPEVGLLAAGLIDSHPRLRFLQDWRVAYLLEHGNLPKPGAKHAWGKTRLIPRWLQPLAPYDAGVVVNAEVWQLLPQRQREALVLHELCHLRQNEDTGALEVVGHDVEEFGFVVATYGQWRPSLEGFAEQLALGLRGADAAGS